MAISITASWDDVLNLAIVIGYVLLTIATEPVLKFHQGIAQFTISNWVFVMKATPAVISWSILHV